MSTKEDVLTYLEQHRGISISGESLAERLNVSRTAVWKAIKTLQNEGYTIQAIRNKGYTLDIHNDVLSELGIKKYLHDSTAPTVVVSEIESTNLTARQLASQGAMHGSVVVADSQSNGRGRKGRAFLSPKGTGLYMSIIIRNTLPINQAVLITCAAAVAVCRAIKQVIGKELEIKWVNDLFYHGKKCCGILTEANIDMETGGLDYLVVGIGINLFPPDTGWPKDLKKIAGSILKQGEFVDRCRLAAAITNELLGLCSLLPETEFIKEYKARNMVLGKDIFILQNDTCRSAYAESITDEGHLLIVTPDGKKEELSYGEVSIRL